MDNALNALMSAAAMAGNEDVQEDGFKCTVTGNYTFMCKDREIFDFSYDGTTFTTGNVRGPVPYMFHGLSDENIATKLESWLVNRTIEPSRRNASKITAGIGIPKYKHDDRITVALICLGVSMKDTYWVRDNVNKNVRFADVDLRQMTGSTMDFNAAIKGIDGNPSPVDYTANLMTAGENKKVWIRDDVYGICLCKQFTKEESRKPYNENIKLEQQMSEFLIGLGVPAVRYFISDLNGERLSCSTKAHVDNIIEWWEIKETLGSRSDALFVWAKNNSPLATANMIIADFLIGNRKRTTHDGGFVADDEGRLENFAPLWDFDEAMDDDLSSSVSNDRMLRSKYSLFEMPFKDLLPWALKNTKINILNIEPNYSDMNRRILILKNMM